MNESRYRQAEHQMWESVGVQPTEQRLQLPRIGTSLRVQEVGDGPPIVFVHGASSCGTTWASLVSRLEGFRCILVDRPGCGLSEPLRTTFDDVGRLEEFAEALIVDVLDALGLERAHLAATSFGGYMALRTAATHPDRVDRMIEFGWTMGAPIERTPLVMRVGSIRLLGRLMTAVPPNERMVRTIFRQIGLRQALEAGKISQEMVRLFLALLRDTDTMRNELRQGPRILTPVRGINDTVLLTSSLLEGIKPPIYFLWGDGDPMGGAATARAFVNQLPNAELELMPGAGHAVWMDDADHAAAATASWLGRS